MSDLWRTLKVGDRVRILSWPQEMHRDRLDCGTQELYDWLIDTQTVLIITSIDYAGLPYVEINRIVDGTERFEYLALNHGSIGLVEEVEQ